LEKIMLVSCQESVRPTFFAFHGFVDKALFLIALVLSSSPLHATSVVALIDSTNQRLVIAADCRVNRGDGFSQECKIIEEPDCVAAIAGFYQDQASGFHLRELVRLACQQPGDLRSKAEAFVRLARPSYERAIRRAREKQLTGSTYQPTQVIFAGRQDGRIALIVRAMEGDSNGHTRFERFDSIGFASGPTAYFLGLNGHIRAYIKSHPDWVHQDLAKLAHQFVEMEIKAHPDLVGLPISELEIDEKGNVRWLEHGVCGDHLERANENGAGFAYRLTQT
jgi:hypothetical protein